MSLSVASSILGLTKRDMNSVGSVANVDTNKVLPAEDAKTNVELEINVANDGDVAA